MTLDATHVLQQLNVLVLLASLAVCLYLLARTRVQLALRGQRQARRRHLQRYLFAAINTSFPVRAAHLPRLDLVHDPLVCLDMMLDLFRSVDGIDLRPALRAYAVWGQLPALCRLAREGDPAVRIKALALMGHMEDSDTETALLSALNSADLNTRMVAIRSLAHRGAREHMGRVLRAMYSHGGGTDRLFADALIRFGPDVAGTLIAWRERLEAHPVVLAGAVLALGEWGYRGAINVLEQALTHPSGTVRQAALAAMTRMKVLPSDAALQHLTRDECCAVRTALTQMDGSSHALFRALSQLVDDADADVALDAVRALANLGSRGHAYLTTRASLADDAIAALCTAALGEAGAPLPQPAWLRH